MRSIWAVSSGGTRCARQAARMARITWVAAAHLVGEEVVGWPAAAKLSMGHGVVRIYSKGRRANRGALAELNGTSVRISSSPTARTTGSSGTYSNILDHRKTPVAARHHATAEARDGYVDHLTAWRAAPTRHAVVSRYELRFQLLSAAIEAHARDAPVPIQNALTRSIEALARRIGPT